MIRLRMKLGEFIARLGGRKQDAGEEPARFAAPAHRSKMRDHEIHPFHAVSIKPGLISCTKACKLRDVRMLSRQAPSIPLPGCTNSKDCTCRFQKHNDRRQGDRRLFGAEQDGRFYSSEERRRTRGRRASDPRPQAS